MSKDKKPDTKPPAKPDRSDKFVWKEGDLVIEKAAPKGKKIGKEKTIKLLRDRKDA